MIQLRRKRLKDILAHMRERCYGRIGNRSDNAFRLRKFAKMYDKEQTGYVRSNLYTCSALEWCEPGHVI